jgi:hypothetical protein
MGKPGKLHEVQQLAGRIAALSQFVVRLGQKALSFYALMKNSDKKFELTEEAVTSEVFIKFLDNFFLYYLYCVKNHRELKFLCLYKRNVTKTFPNFPLLLEEFF